MERQFSIPRIKIDGVTTSGGSKLRKTDRRLSSRTDIELESSTLEESMSSFADNTEI